MDEYTEFIRTKHLQDTHYGFDVEFDAINTKLFEWQRRVVQWAIKRGRSAMFLDTGLGKTACQLTWSEHVVRETGGSVLLHCPLGVRMQTKSEAEKFGIGVPVIVADSSHDVPSEPSIVIANYEKIHKFKPSRFVGVVLDESSILKSFTGAIKRQLCESWEHATYRLACTATPSPNDHMELGNHAEFLGVMPSNEMLSRWFYNDTMQAGGYKILPHAWDDFWEWVATWAVSVGVPSDVGGSDDGYILPALVRHDHIVEVTNVEPEPGMLFYAPELNATTIHKDKRRSVDDRAAKVADIIAREPDETWLIWCDTNYEADVLRKMIDDSVDIRGSERTSVKEQKLAEFSSGKIKRLITKPSVAGFGLNWQHCRRMAFVGLSYSYEQYYQAVRRCWRFGQPEEVHVHVIMAETEEAIMRSNARKQTQHKEMQVGMIDAVRKYQRLVDNTDMSKSRYHTNERMSLPSWMLQS